MAGNKKYILDSTAVQKKLERLALEVIENNIDETELLLVGIAENGIVLAEQIKKYIQKNADITVSTATLHLDKKHPEAVTLVPAVALNGRSIILIDDVTNSGRTLLYALKPFLEHHPKKIQTLVLVERTHTQFPISANYKGISLATTLQEHIYVEVNGDTIKGAYLR